MKSSSGRRLGATGALVATSALVVAMMGVSVRAEAEPAAAAAASAARADGGTLVVKVRRPGSKPATVVVTGPGGFRRTIAKTTRLTGLANGTYRIKATKVRTTSWVATPKVDRKQVTLSTRKRSAKVGVDYATIVSTDLKALPTKAVTSFVAPTDTAPGTLVSTQRLKKGQIVASSTSGAAPDGMLVEVVSGKGSTYVVKQATVQDAIPRGSFDTTFAADLAEPTSGRKVAGRGGSGAAGGKALPVSCKASGAAGLEMNAYGGVEMSMSADWDFADSSLSIVGTANAGAQARAYLEAAGSCTLAETLLYQRRFAPINLQVGPVPIVILPKLEMFVGGQVSATGRAEIKGGVNVTASVTGKASRKGLITSTTGPDLTKSAGLTASATAAASVYAKAKVTGELYGVAGPHATVRLGIDAKADSAANPWWTVDGTASAGVGVKVDKCISILWKDVCLSFDKSRDDLFSRSIRLADSGGPFTKASGIVADVAGSGVTISSPVTDSDGGGTGRISGLTPGGDAWVLSTGAITDVPGTDAGVLASRNRDAPGNETLAALAGRPTYDATFVKMTVVPAGNRLRIDYLFATEEYPDFVNTQYNDVMGVFVNGTNCAVVPGTSSPVSVNTINDKTASAYFVDNLDSHLPTVMNGLTVPLRCTVAVVPGQPVDVLIGVADASDGVLDSAVALVDGGIASFNG